MTNGIMQLLRKGWDSLKMWVAAMEYSSVDYTNDRISWLEHEVEQLKAELTGVRMSAGTVDGGFETTASARET
jgi:hypothetical protein